MPLLGRISVNVEKVVRFHIPLWISYRVNLLGFSPITVTSQREAYLPSSFTFDAKTAHISKNFERCQGHLSKFAVYRS